MAEKFKIVTTALGAKSILHVASGEILHHPVGPWREAQDLYVTQSRLREKLQTGEQPLVIFDVGLGAATNAVAALSCHSDLIQKGSRENPVPRKLIIVSFEIDTEITEFALNHSSELEFLEPFKDVVRELLKNGKVETPQFSWYLRRGDFRETICSETFHPEVIFFDAYSPRNNSEMWSLDVFRNLYRLSLKPSQTKPNIGTMLVTYSRSTPCRSALLLAGFCVGIGQSTGEKDETTIASTNLDELKTPLPKEWLSRWTRSSTPFPAFDIGQSGTPSFDVAKELLTNHPQFKGLDNLKTPEI